MSRRVKLTTEWATWTKRNDSRSELRGALEHVARVCRVNNRFVFIIFPRPRLVFGSNGFLYDGENVMYAQEEHRETMEQAQHAAELALVEIGLIDPMWWVTQCPDE